MIDSSPPPPPTPRPPLSFTVVWTIFALFTFVAVGGTAQMLQLAWGLWFSEIILFAGMGIVGLQVLRMDPAQAMGTTLFEPRAFGVGFAYGALNYVAWAVPLMALAQKVFPRSLVEAYDSARVFDRNTPVELAIVLVGVSVAAPLGEEIFFRGFLQRTLGLHRGAPQAIVVAAVVFTIFHIDPVGLVPRFELGVLFGLLYWRTGSLWAAIAAHAANNAISSAIYLAAGDAKETDLAWWLPLVMFVVGNAALFVLWRATKDSLRVDQPSAVVDVPSPGAVRVLGPWLVAGVVSTALVVAVDWRGMKLNLMDAVLAPGKELRQRADVKALRARVRSGEEEFGAYEARVKELKEGLPSPQPSPPRGEGVP